MSDWFDSLSAENLQDEAPSLHLCPDDIEEAASYMYREGKHQAFASGLDKDEMIKRSMEEVESRLPKKYWEAVKVEMHILLCTSDKKYDDLRKQLTIESKNGTNAIVIGIAAAFGSVLGVEATAIVGFCAAVLYGAIKIGKEAFCALQDA